MSEKVFNDVKQGDVITLDMRVTEMSRHILMKMFMSSKETEEALLKGLSDACSRVNVTFLMESEATKAINDAVSNYFKYGHGNQVINEVVKTTMDKQMDGVMKALVSRKKKAHKRRKL